MTHTPGPWEIVAYNKWLDKGKGGDWAGEIVGSNGEKVYAGAASFHAINKLANARLIATAPELLEACEELVDIIDNITEGNRPWTDLDSFTTQPAKSAIAKARREE